MESEILLESISGGGRFRIALHAFNLAVIQSSVFAHIAGV